MGSIRFVNFSYRSRFLSHGNNSVSRFAISSWSNRVRMNESEGERERERRELNRFQVYRYRREQRRREVLLVEPREGRPSSHETRFGRSDAQAMPACLPSSLSPLSLLQQNSDKKYLSVSYRILLLR